MDTGESRRALIVGIFISLGIVIFILGIFTLGSNQKSFGGGIQVSAVFDDVAGLKKGGAVWFSGVKVGTINDIRFKGTSLVNVKMTIDKSVQDYIHRNAQVHISSDGLIGNKIIVIDGGSPQAPAVQDGDQLQAAKLLSTDDITATLQKNNVNILAITTDLKKITKMIAEGKGMVGALVGDTVMPMKFKAILDNLAQTTITAKAMAVQMDKFGTNLNRKGTLADKLLTDTSTYGQFKAAVTNFQNASAKGKQMMDTLNKAISQLNSPNSVYGVLMNNPEKAEKVKRIIDNIHTSSVLLNEDLKAAQSNFLLRGYFKDLAKAKADSIKKANKK